MASWRVRDLHDDPDRVVRVWEHSRKASVDPVAEVAEILAAIEVMGPSSLWSGGWSSA